MQSHLSLASDGAGQPLSDVVVGPLLESVPDGIVIVGRDGTILFANEAAETMFGYRREELIGEAVEVLLPADQRGRHTAHRLRYVAAPRKRPMGEGLELRGRRRDGSEFPVEISLSPAASPDGDVAFAAVRDVSVRRSADEELRRFRRLLGGIDEAVYLIDRQDLRFSYANQGAVSLTGYPADQLLTMTPMHLLPTLSQRELRDELEPVLSGARPSMTLTTNLRHRSGRDVPIELRVDAPQVEGDSEPRLVAFVRDMSEHVAREAEARRADELASLSADRERIARDLHDTVIQELFASGLTLASLSPRLPADLRDRVQAVIDRQDKVIREIRTTIFALTARGQDLHEFQNQVLDVVDEAAQPLGVRPALRLQGLMAKVGKDLCEQAIPTLREALSNVSRHARASRVEIDVIAGDDLVVRITDDGVGLPEGLACPGNGLRNMRQRAEHLGGELRLSETDGGGTTLEWVVPL